MLENQLNVEIKHTASPWRSVDNEANLSSYHCLPARTAGKVNIP
jgi:hypothetical protein